MYLWKQEMQSYRDRLQSIPPFERLAIAVSVMDWTLAEMGQIQPGVVSEYIASSMQKAHEAVGSGVEKLTISDEMLDSWNDVDDQAEEAGTTHIMSAILACADAPGGLSGEVLYGVLCFCYEALRERFEESDVGLEAERRSDKCVEAISFQKARIIDFL
ncbi:hypothetical protein ACFVUN_27175 [Kitasatospora griseola]|uniref:hypothetical protein n=1 Tax=Kitasatospora griseola TaxID=2064 RepID=UPI0036D965DD